MQLKFGLVALSAIATLVLSNGNSVEAKSESTEKKEAVKVQKVVEKAPEKAPEKVVEIVQPGDNLSAIAEKHATSYIRLYNANPVIVNPDLIYAGNELRIPTADEQLENRFAVLPAPEQAAAVSSSTSYQSYANTSSAAPRGSSAGNTYYPGCTWYAKEMRPDLPNRLGNGGQWVASARAQGIATGTTPRVGAIAEQAGHVAYVQAVNGNMVTISEMGYAGNSGVNTRTVPASTFFGYIY